MSLVLAERVLRLYKYRWNFERLFVALKTRGFNPESTNMTDPDKLSTLLAILAIASRAVQCEGLGAEKGDSN
jgi:hypothetical protein